MNEEQTQTGQAAADEKTAEDKKQTDVGATRRDRQNGRSGQKETPRDPYAKHGQRSAAFNLVWEKALIRKRLLHGEEAARHPANQEQ